MYQYEIYFANDYLFEIMTDLSQIMGIKYDNDKLQKVFKFKEKNNAENLFISYEENRQYFICIDCDNVDWIYPLIVRCSVKQHEGVNKCMLEWDNRIREEYGQDLTERIGNSYGNEDTLLKRIESKYKISI
ncbi:hypothetical protein [Enterococcus sp. LJL51]|uniref:hypothetical protein n=1 Tax=Enterococcus sp. LJL51 TaxID=3416656 RepID=UPI003CF4B956